MKPLNVEPTSYDVPACACPHCLKINDMAASLHGGKPREGMISLCIDCGGVSLFGRNFALIKPSEAQLAEITTEHGPLIEYVRCLIKNKRKEKTQ